MIKIEFSGTEANEVFGEICQMANLVTSGARVQNALAQGQVKTSASAQAAAPAEEKPATQATAETELDPELERVEIDNRPIGKPAEGKQRRNKDEIAADEELTKLADLAGRSVDEVNAAIEKAATKGLGRDAVAAQLQQQADKPNISTAPEDRKDPAQEEVTREDILAAAKALAEARGNDWFQANFATLVGAQNVSELVAKPNAERLAALEAMGNAAKGDDTPASDDPFA